MRGRHSEACPWHVDRVVKLPQVEHGWPMVRNGVPEVFPASPRGSRWSGVGTEVVSRGVGRCCWL